MRNIWIGGLELLRTTLDALNIRERNRLSHLGYLFKEIEISVIRSVKLICNRGMPMFSGLIVHIGFAFADGTHLSDALFYYTKQGVECQAFGDKN